MKIATYIVTGINGRLPVLLRWLVVAEPDIVCLPELKKSQDRFPEAALRDLDMMRSGMASKLECPIL